MELHQIRNTVFLPRSVDIGFSDIVTVQWAMIYSRNSISVPIILSKICRNNQDQRAGDSPHLIRI